MIRNINIEDKTIEPAKLATSIDKYVFETIGVQPQLSSVNGDAVPAGTTGATNRMALSGADWTYFILGLGQTILGPRITAAGGLDIALDKTDDEGAEYVLGLNATNGRFAFTIQTSEAFFFRAKLKIADVSGTDEFLVGFRKVQAFATAHATYTDYAALGINVAAATADVKSMTDNDDAGEVSTDTTKDWADAETHTIEVKVDAIGNVTFFWDGIQLGVPAFAFDATDVVVPFIFYLHATTTPGVVELIEYECGPQSARRP